MWDKGVERRELTSDCLCILMVIRDALSSTRCWPNVQHYYLWKCWSENHSTVNILDVSALLGRVYGQINPCCTVLWWPARSQAEMPRASFGKQETLGVFWNKSAFVKRRVYRAAPLEWDVSFPEGNTRPCLVQVKQDTSTLRWIPKSQDRIFKYKLWGILHLKAALGEICLLPEPCGTHHTVADFISDLWFGQYH